MLSVAALEYHRNKVFMKVTRRSLRDALDPFDMPDERYITLLVYFQKTLSPCTYDICIRRFREMYRFPRSLAVDFLNLIKESMDEWNPCPDIPMTIQFCSVLNFYASGSYQRRVGSDTFATISQSVVSKCIRTYSFVIATKIMDKFVQFPQNVDDVQKLHNDLQSQVDFPGAFAVVDGSLIGLAAVSHSIEHMYVSRKSFHAINTQFVCDIRMRFLNVNARYAGSTHDSLIWRASMANATLRRMCNAMGMNWRYYMLGDNGYPLQPWLMKPYDSPNSPEKLLYNKNHRKLRSLIERAIGLLKARFRCLLNERRLRYDPLMSGYIIYACSTLHNFLIEANYPVDDIQPVFESPIGVFEERLDDFDICIDELRRGNEVRNNMAHYFYGI